MKRFSQSRLKSVPKSRFKRIPHSKFKGFQSHDPKELHTQNLKGFQLYIRFLSSVNQIAHGAAASGCLSICYCKNFKQNIRIVDDLFGLQLSVTIVNGISKL